MRKNVFLTYSRRLLQIAAIAATPFLSPISASAQINAEQVLTIGRNVLSMVDYRLAFQYFNLAINEKPFLGVH